VYKAISLLLCLIYHRSSFDQAKHEEYYISMSNVVLLVEDSDFIRDMYKLKLSKAKIDVLEAVDGSMALSMISEHKPKLVLLDLMMPNVTGLEVLEELDKQKMTPELPVIVLTNMMDKPTIDKAKNLGARDYIIKTDLTPGEVLEKIMPYLA
jgi:PleD family two-component response regulator